jgi:hypothetical protein
VSKDSIETILLELSNSNKYNRKSWLLKPVNIDDDMYRRIKVVIADSEEQTTEVSLDKLFGILKIHFPMLTSEQIHTTLLKEGKIGDY